MKPHIHTLQDTLVFQLQGLYYTERKIRNDFEECSRELTSPKLKEEMTKYGLGADSRLLMFERIFNYLMIEPEARRNKVVVRLVEETMEMIDITDSPHLKDILMVSCLQNLNAYKVSSLKAAYMFTIELEMDTASELLQQVLESELETGKALTNLAIEEFNKGQEMVTA